MVPLPDGAFSQIQRLSANDIELKAEEVLEYFRPELLHRAKPTPIKEIVDKGSQEFGFEFRVEELGVSRHGNKILGTFRFAPRAIVVDTSVLGTVRFPFTLAHEFGHLLLHRALKITAKDYAIRDTERHLVTGRKNLRTKREWIEWQANRFAAALLVPRSTLRDTVVAIQQKCGILRRLGSVYVETDPYSDCDFKRLLVELEAVYEASHAVLEYRLSDLGILIDRRGKDISHISELLRE